MGLGAYTVAIVQARWARPYCSTCWLALRGHAGRHRVGLPSLLRQGPVPGDCHHRGLVHRPFLFANLRLTAGNGGLTLQPATVFGVALDTSFRLYWGVRARHAADAAGAANLFRTRIGRAFIAIRDRDISPRCWAYPLLRYNCCRFGLSSFYAGRGGAGCVRDFFRVVTPESFPS